MLNISSRRRLSIVALISGIALSTVFLAHEKSYAQTPPMVVAPSWLTAMAVSSTQIRLSWRDNSNNETSFAVEKSTNGVSFTQVTGSIPANTTTYIMGSLSAGTRYYFRVRARRNVVNSPYSNVAGAVTVATTTGALPPSSSACGQITEFPIRSNNRPGVMTMGSDGNLWFAESYPAGFGKINASGVITEYYFSPLSYSTEIAALTLYQSSIWFTDNAPTPKLGFITPTGSITRTNVSPTLNLGGLSDTQHNGIMYGDLYNNKIKGGGYSRDFSIPTPMSYPQSLTLGPDRNIWFTESNAKKIGRITTGASGVAGVIMEFAVSNNPQYITKGPDSRLWFTQQGSNKVGAITTSGVLTEYPVPGAGSYLGFIITGKDGNLWAADEWNNKIWRINPRGGGNVTAFPIPMVSGEHLGGIAVGPDNNIWFSVLAATSGNRIGKISCTGGF